MLQSVLLILGLAALAPWVHRLAGRWSARLYASVGAGLFAYFASLAPRVYASEPIAQRWEWIEALHVAISFRLDGLALVFAFLVTGVGALILLYAGAYMKDHPRVGAFFASLLLFMASMLGLVLADNVVTLFIFWELTSVSSFLLIGFDRQREGARRAAMQALLVTGLGGMALLGGLAMLATAAGSWELHEIAASGGAIRAHALFLPAFALVALGAFTKSAQFPFHFWLPNAMEAPTPVSAYLHSSTMVKAGVYLLARLHPALGGNDVWFHTLTWVGAATFVVGGLLATRETAMKRILAYTTVASLGALVMMLGVGTQAALVAMSAFLVAHALYKGALFLIAGAVDHEAGEKYVDRLGGLRRAMPLTAACAAIAALSMAGVPPTLGFIAKETILEGVAHDTLGWTLLALATLGSTLTVAAAAIVGLRPFFGRPRETPRTAHDPGPEMLAGPFILAALGLIGGLMPALFADSIVSATATTVGGAPIEKHLHLWHGFTLALALSAAALVVGAAIALLAARWRRALAPIGALSRFGPERLYGAGLGALNVLAVSLTGVYQNGRLRRYTTVVFVFTGLLVGASLVRLGALSGLTGLDRVYPFDAIVCMAIIAGAIAAICAKGRLGAVAALGIVGYGVTVLYVVYGAPDLALTLVSVETLTVILFVLVLYHLPRFAIYTSRAARVRDMVIAVSFGAVMCLLTLIAADVQFSPTISEWFVENSVPKGKGRNIVNVILVDFRALDTMGEITVLGVAAIGVHALLKLKPAAASDGGDES
ncbi:MAG: putative monovalent cation/H+ antiporter subunit A [Phycisphaerales bacterium]|nr:putative monovalent cation/H+ antiporter subunit A [Phycisphaerales bacterium]